MKETLAYCSRPLPPWGNQSRAASPRLPGVPAGEVHISADHSGYACSRTDLAALPNLAVSPQAGGNTCAAGSLTACGNLSGTNTLMIDPDFNTRVVRVTDANTNPGHLNFTYTAGIGIGGSGVALAPIREFCTSGDETPAPRSTCGGHWTEGFSHVINNGNGPPFGQLDQPYLCSPPRPRYLSVPWSRRAPPTATPHPAYPAIRTHIQRGTTILETTRLRCFLRATDRLCLFSDHGTTK